jgi:hypothetical protein
MEKNLKDDFIKKGFIDVTYKNVFIQDPLYPFDPISLKLYLLNKKFSIKWLLLYFFKKFLILQQTYKFFL